VLDTFEPESRDFPCSIRYVRYRATTLSWELTKRTQVMGGLCWCIAASGKGVDANILFNENMQIGKKLKLSEKVCKVLIKMKCKAELLPHQIQGLDFGKLYPVVKWLVQQVYDFRAEHGDMIRDYSIHHFEKHAKIETDAEHEIAFLHDVQSQYQRQRVLRRPIDLWAEDNNTASERQLLQTCLLEFGERVGMDLESLAEDDKKKKGKKKKKKTFDRATASKFANLQKQEKERQEKEEKMQAENEAKLLKILSGTSDQAESSVAKSNVGKLASLQADALKAASDKYSADADETRKMIEAREPHTRRTFFLYVEEGAKRENVTPLSLFHTQHTHSHTHTNSKYEQAGRQQHSSVVRRHCRDNSP
jgi:hypothetical protein